MKAGAIFGQFSYQSSIDDVNCKTCLAIDLPVRNPAWYSDNISSTNRFIRNDTISLSSLRETQTRKIGW